MIGRDRRWRAAGAALSVGACLAALTSDSTMLVLLLFPLAFVGIALMVNGKRVAVLLRAEWRGHPHTAQLIHSRRIHRWQQHFRRDEDTRSDG